MIYLSWALMLFAAFSGVVKIYGINVERQGAEQLGIDYRLIMLMGLLQLIAVPLIYYKQYWGGVVLLGVPYLAFVYFGIADKQPPLAILSMVIFGLTLLLYLLA